MLTASGCSSAPIQSIRLHQKILCCSGGLKYFERGYPGRGRLEPVRQPDGSYALPYVFLFFSPEIDGTEDCNISCWYKFAEMQQRIANYHADINFPGILLVTLTYFRKISVNATKLLSLMKYMSFVCVLFVSLLIQNLFSLLNIQISSGRPTLKVQSSILLSTNSRR